MLFRLEGVFPLLLTSFAVISVAAAPSPASVGSDLFLLVDNDLNWPTAQDHDGTVLISTPSTNAQAIASCGELHENLLTVNGTYSKSDMTNLLRHLALGAFSSSQMYWIRSSGTDCLAISLNGTHSITCSESLPAFCSQSAPYRPNVRTDTSPQYQVEIPTGNNTILGTRDHLSFRFIGIPYADPVERWTYSKVNSAAGNITALKYGSPCTQTSIGSEDCLFLNVYTPYLPRDSSKSKNLKSVMFGIHGGAFMAGESSAGPLDGGNLASRGDVVVVTINYRLNTLGFLALDDGVTHGNYGIADQITALRWVHAHIADFGGDPSRITIFGQSAGAASVRALLTARPAFGLFSGAIAQSNLDGSGYSSTYSNYYTIEQAYTVAAKPLIEYVGCENKTDVLACLRGIPAAKLANAPTAPRYIVVDGTYITTNQLELNGTGNTAPAHVIFGWMRDDGFFSWPAEGANVSQAIMGSGIDQTLTDKIVKSGLFPVPSSSINANVSWNLANVTGRISTDNGFRCLDQATALAAAKNNVFPSVYAYQFDRSYAGYMPLPDTCVPPATKDYPHGDPSLPYFRCHSGDLFYTFGTLGQTDSPFRDGDDLVLSQLAVDAWTAFARTFDPNPSFDYLAARGYVNTTEALNKHGLWEKVTPSATAPVRLFDVPPSNSPYLEQAQCDLLGYPLSSYS